MTLMRSQIGAVAAFRHVCVVPKLPKTRSGKILRATLRSLADGARPEIPATIEDPGTYAKPWTTGWNVKWVPNWELYEYVCQENNKDVMIEHHMVGALPSKAE